MRFSNHLGHLSWTDLSKEGRQHELQGCPRCLQWLCLVCPQDERLLKVYNCMEDTIKSMHMQGGTSAVAAHALSLEDSGVLFDASPPPRGPSRLPPTGETSDPV